MPATSAPARPDPGGDTHRPSRIGFVAGALVLVASAVFWVWAFSPWAPRGNPDRLEDRTFPERAEQICSEASERIEALPPASDARTPQERAVVVQEANELLSSMIEELRGSATGTAEDVELISLWLDDYEVLLSDRERHAARLAAGEDPRFTVTATDEGSPIDERIDGFARVNDMESCLVPLDV